MIQPSHSFVNLSSWVPKRVDISNQHFKSIVDCYELIFNLLTTATNKNQLVKLKTNDIKKDTICDIISWWAIVQNQFQPSDVQIKLLHEKYTACVQTDGQTGTKYLQKVEQKADDLRKLGELYTSVEIGNKVYKGLNFQLQQFLYTNFMSQQIVNDSTSISVLLNIYEDMEARDNSNSKFSKLIYAYLDSSYTRDKNDRRNSNASDFFSRNPYNQRRFSYHFLVTYKGIIETKLNYFTSIVKLKRSIMQQVRIPR